jgi:hypothetical protein
VAEMLRCTQHDKGCAQHDNAITLTMLLPLKETHKSAMLFKEGPNRYFKR